MGVLAAAKAAPVLPTAKALKSGAEAASQSASSSSDVREALRAALTKGAAPEPAAGDRPNDALGPVKCRWVEAEFGHAFTLQTGRMAEFSEAMNGARGRRAVPNTLDTLRRKPAKGQRVPRAEQERIDGLFQPLAEATS